MDMDGSFAILEHSGCGPVHFDFLLEDGAVLATWQFQRSLADLEAGSQRCCQKIHDHRLLYLTYEGEISGGRGQVCRVEQGKYKQIKVSETYWRFKLQGEIMRGDYSLTRQGNTDQWILARNEV
jgi:hypothetical protein